MKSSSYRYFHELSGSRTRINSVDNDDAGTTLGRKYSEDFSLITHDDLCSNQRKLSSHGENIEWRSSDELHNMNCFDFFVHLFSELDKLDYETKSKFYHLGVNLKGMTNIQTLATNLLLLKGDQWILQKKYPSKNVQNVTPFGDHYTEFMDLLESICKEGKHVAICKTLIEAIYSCPQTILDRAARPTFNKSDNDIELMLTLKGLEDTKHKRINKISPRNRGSSRGLFGEMASSESHPMNTTSLSCMRKYHYQDNHVPPHEIRMGTQAVITNNHYAINPIFLAWIKLSQTAFKQNPQEIKLHRHLYFNLLSAHNHSYQTLNLTKSYEKNKEAYRSAALHQGASQSEGLLMVVDLPAENAIFNHKLSISESKNKSAYDAFETMLEVATNPQFGKNYDFHIAPDILAEIDDTLKGNKKLFSQILQMDISNKVGGYKHLCQLLLEKSFKMMGLDIADTNKVPDKKIQAAYFQFIKFEIPNMLLKVLQPNSYNMTCKDGIDRGGVASAYYHLIKSIEVGDPLTEYEFHEALHAAPINVKGRRMNENIHSICNAVDYYLHNIHATQKSVVIPEWLYEWRQKEKQEHENKLTTHHRARHHENSNAAEQSANEWRHIPLDSGSYKHRPF